MKQQAIRPRSRRYSTKFWGVSEIVLSNFVARIESGKERAKSFYLLSTFLLESNWDFHRPEREFRLSQRKLRELTGWAYHSIRAYTSVLVDADILSVKKRNTYLNYSVNCGLLGVRPSVKRSKNKARKPYVSKFWGMTRGFRNNGTERISESSGRSMALWLLANMLVYSDWSADRAGEPFPFSERNLQTVVGWHRKTIRRYRDMLVDAGILEIDLPGGRGVAAQYILDIEIAGIEGPTRTPTRRLM